MMTSNQKAEKPAPAQYSIHDLIRRRWSPRAFADRMVERDKIRSLLEAARWAPSCFNEQPWAYLVATKDQPEDFQQMLRCLVEKNQRWAQGAPVLMLSFAKKTFARNGHPNRTAQHDVGLASENLTLQALDLGLFVHQMAGIELEKIRQTYDVPSDYDPVAGIAIGYPGDAEKLAQDFREAEKAPRSRKPLPQFVFSMMWGHPSELAEDVAQD
jgi:nitroreductase